MGIGFVLSIWGVIGLVIAGLGSLVMRGVAAYLTRGAADRGKLLRIATVFPVTCLIWAGIVFVFQGVINVVFLHRDLGIGDGFDCPLPNGYALSFIDVTNIGTLYRAGNHPLWADDQENAIDAVRDVVVMELAGPYVLGGADSKRLEHFAQDSYAADSYFVLDTRTDERTDFKTYVELREAAQRLGIQPNLVAIDSLYSKYRFTWFDAFAGLLLILPPLIAAALMMRSVVRLRMTRAAAA
jgi:hypothetical protein